MMSFTVEVDLRRAFELATLRRQAKVLHRPEQWRAVSKLEMRCEQARLKEEKLYRARYHTRVEQRRRRLIDEAAAKPLELKPWWAQIDRFSARESLLQAQRDVRLAHERRLQRVDAFESRELSGIVTKAQRDNMLREWTMEAFADAAGPERRRNRAH